MSLGPIDINHPPNQGALNGGLITVPNSPHYKLILEQFYQLKFFQHYFDNPSNTMIMSSGGLALRHAYS